MLVYAGGLAIVLLAGVAAWLLVQIVRTLAELKQVTVGLRGMSDRVRVAASRQDALDGTMAGEFELDRDRGYELGPGY
jgi:hypothetical protein